MQPLFDRTQWDCEIETPGDSRDVTVIDGRKIDVKDAVRKANAVPISLIFSLYNIRIDDYTKKARCPFHNNGNEKTPSFYWYPDTNSFHCFGCQVNGRPSDLVSLFRKCPKIDGAIFILERWSNYLSGIEVNEENYCYNNNIVLSFSDLIRDFITKNKSVEAISFAESMAFSFDKMLKKYNPSKEVIESMIFKIKKQLEEY